MSRPKAEVSGNSEPISVFVGRGQELEYIESSIALNKSYLRELPNPLLWVTGPPGIGKTAFLRNIERIYRNHWGQPLSPLFSPTAAVYADFSDPNLYEESGR